MASTHTVTVPCPQQGEQALNIRPTGTEQWQVSLPSGELVTVRLIQAPGPNGMAIFSVNNTAYKAQAMLTEDHLALWLNGTRLTIPRITKGPRRAGAAVAAGASGHAVVASMPGKVVAQNASVGQSVNAGDVLVIMESMKMELSLAAPCSGTVTAVSGQPGETVDQGTVLVNIDPDTES